MTKKTGVDIEWGAPDAAPTNSVCPNCGTAGVNPVLLTAQAWLPKQGRLHVRLRDCSHCGCAFADDYRGYPYSAHAADALSIAIYVEAGAGLWPIARTLARLRLPPGASYLEIGCGFGFGLDYAVRARGWQGTGIDPSPLARAGKTMLGLPIESRYVDFAAESMAISPERKVDCILASEVIEHMADPLAFVAILRNTLMPGGILVLTTPDRAQLRQGASISALVPLVSVGDHLVLQTAHSLDLLLARSGFAVWKIEADGDQLIAYASDSPLDLEQDYACLRHSFRVYLAASMAAAVPASMLWWGFATRAYIEAVADNDSPAAARHWADLRHACQARFGFDLDRPDTIPPLFGTKIDKLARLIPKALPNLLYARALDRLHAGETMPDVAPFFESTLLAETALNAALLPLGASDLAALASSRQALANLAALAAQRAHPDCFTTLSRAIAADPQNVQTLARRSFVGLVNAGAIEQAKELCSRWDIDARALDHVSPDRPVDAETRDALFCLAILSLQEKNAEPIAMQRFARVRTVVESQGTTEGDLWWSALRGECIAADRIGQHDHTDRLLGRADIRNMPDDLRERFFSCPHESPVRSTEAFQPKD